MRENQALQLQQLIFLRYYQLFLFSRILWLRKLALENAQNREEDTESYKDPTGHESEGGGFNLLKGLMEILSGNTDSSAATVTQQLSGAEKPQAKFSVEEGLQKLGTYSEKDRRRVSSRGGPVLIKDVKTADNIDYANNLMDTWTGVKDIPKSFTPKEMKNDPELKMSKGIMDSPYSYNYPAQASRELNSARMKTLGAASAGIGALQKNTLILEATQYTDDAMQWRLMIRDVEVKHGNGPAAYYPREIKNPAEASERLKRSKDGEALINDALAQHGIRKE